MFYFWCITCVLLSMTFNASFRSTHHFTYKARNNTTYENCKWSLVKWRYSKVVISFIYIFLHLAWLESNTSKDNRGTSIEFKFCMSLSLYHNRGCPILQVLSCSWLYMGIFGVLSSKPAHWSCDCIRNVCMPLIFTLWK